MIKQKIEQRIEIPLSIKNGDFTGTFSISAEIFSNKKIAKDFQTDIVNSNIDFNGIPISLLNVPICDSVGNVFPIIIQQNNEEISTKIFLLEETRYQISFEAFPNVINEDLSIELLPFIRNIGERSIYFEQMKRRGKKYMDAYGIINFLAFVGNSYFDVKINDYFSEKIAFEVRSKKIGYKHQYRKMIEDLWKIRSGLTFNIHSPLFEKYDFNSIPRNSLYQDFMYLDYILKRENLPEAFSTVSNNLHNNLITKRETVPISLARDVDPSGIVQLISDTNCLSFTDCNDNRIADCFTKYLPNRYNQLVYVESLDTQENRLVKEFLLMVENLIQYLISSSYASRYVEESLNGFLNQVDDMLGNKWLEDVEKLQRIPSNSQILYKKDGYRDIFKYFIHFNYGYKLMWDEFDDHLNGYNKKLSELYEYWCFFSLLELIGDYANQEINFEDIFYIDSTNWKIKVRRGQKFGKRFTIEVRNQRVDIQFIYNQAFSNSKMNFRSYSLLFKPDFTLKVLVDGNTSFIHFDAKYRSEYFSNKNGYEELENGSSIGDQDDAFLNSEQELSEEELAEIRDEEELINRKYKSGDIYKMHSYKDAIINSHGAYILYPGSKTNVFEVKLGDPIPSIGAFPLTPGMSDKEKVSITNFIEGILIKLISKNPKST